MTMAGHSVPWGKKLSWLAVAALSLTAACSGGGSSSSSSDRTTTTAGGTSTTASGGSTTTSDAAGSTGGPTVDGVDLGATPAVFAVQGVGDGGVSFYAYANLGADPVVVPLKVTLTSETEKTPYRISPDAQYLAVPLDGDAIVPPRLEILATDTGEVATAADVDVDRLYLRGWAPDSSAVVAGGNGVAKDARYDLDGTTTRLPNSRIGDPLWASGAKGIVPVNQLQFARQVTRSDRGAVVLQDQGNPALVAKLDPDSGKLTPLPGGFSLRGHLWDPVPCDRRFELLGKYVGTGTSKQVQRAIYDADADKIVPADIPTTAKYCPLASNDGKSAAFVSNNGVGVVSLAGGKQATVARTGRPIAWSKDDSHLLVVGPDGVFLVAADGSGGKKASSELGRRLCRGGTSGKIVYATGEPIGTQPESIFVYDLTTDSATQIGTGRFTTPSSCEVSADGAWMVNGGLVIDLVGGHATMWEPKASNGATMRMELHLRDVGIVVKQDTPS